uniref:Uncharacterized protein n=1 Tax=Anopheles merus TaxID=30066 RepID=A0A182V5X2_ANOME
MGKCVSSNSRSSSFSCSSVKFVRDRRCLLLDRADSGPWPFVTWADDSGGCFSRSSAVGGAGGGGGGGAESDRVPSADEDGSSCSDDPRRRIRTIRRHGFVVYKPPNRIIHHSSR